MAITDYLYPLDITGQAATNKVLNERQTLNPPGEPLDYHFILSKAGPYFRDTMKLVHITTGRALVRGVDWMPGHKFHSASYETEGIRGGIYQSILFMDRTLSGQVQLAEYQTLGGTWSLSEAKLLELASNRALDPRMVTYEEVADKPTNFPPIEHPHDIADLTGVSELIIANYDIAAAIRERTQDWLDNPPRLMTEYYTRDEMDAKALDGTWERLVNLGNKSGTVTVDGNTADVFTVTAVGNITWNFTGAPSAVDKIRYFEIRLAKGGNFTMTFPATAVFSSGDRDMTTNGIDKLIIAMSSTYTDVTVVREMA